MRKGKRAYHYKPTTLTLGKLIHLMETQEIIDLTGFSNGEKWFRSLNKTLKEVKGEAELVLPGSISPGKLVSTERRLQV